MGVTDRKVAVLGAGLSGTAAAHLLKDEGARVTVLDSAEERTILKTTIEGMRARGIEVICGPDAERYAEYVELVVLSPGTSGRVMTFPPRLVTKSAPAICSGE